MYWGRPLPLAMFQGARFVQCQAQIILWQDRDWRILAPNVASGVPARPTEIFALDMTQRATERTARLLARNLIFRTVAGQPNARPRFFLVDPGPHDPTPEERAELVHVAPLVRVRDISDEFPAPIPRGLRMLAILSELVISRSSASSEWRGRWLIPAELSIESVHVSTGAERVLEVMQAALGLGETREVPPP